MGEYLLIAAINRTLDPTSKNGIAEWFENTILGKLMEVSSPSLTSQDFWNNMDKIAVESIPKIEEAIVEHIIREFDVDITKLKLNKSDQGGDKGAKEVLAVGTEKEIHGRKRMLVLTFNPALQKGQLQGLD